MANLEPWQVRAIDAYVEICRIDEHGIAGPIFGPELDLLAEKVRAKAPWSDLLTPWDVASIALRRLTLRATKVPRDFIGLLKGAPEGARLVGELRADLVEYFESLPRAYYVFFPLINVPAIGQAELPLTEAISIVDTSIADGPHARLIQQYSGLLVALNRGRPLPHLEPDTRYLRIQLSGYSDESLTSPVAVSALAQLKHFLFVALARRVFKEAPSWTLQHKIAGSVASHVNPDQEEQYALRLPDEFNRYLHRMELDTTELTYYDTSGGIGLLSGVSRPPQTPPEFAWALTQRFGRLPEFLAIPRDAPDAVRIKAALEWWIDGVVSENQTISFLQFCIGFEALLGESGDNTGRSVERGITERLADRYAYLRGRTQSEREAHRVAFTTMYKRRGQIVHQRETHLRRNDDAEACRKAREMLFGAIADELNAFMRVLPKPA